MDQYRMLISSEDIQARVRKLAEQISNDYFGKNPLLLTLLKGAFIFLSDLVRHLKIPHEVDFITLSSYRHGSRRSGKIEILSRLKSNIEDRHVIIIDGIIDTGHTLSHLIGIMSKHRVRSLSVCTLLDKPGSREVDISADYVGFTIPEVFVVGYGLDFNERFRNLSYIAELAPYFESQEAPLESPVHGSTGQAKRRKGKPASAAAQNGPDSAMCRPVTPLRSKPDS
ncbi:MAG: hypoxanthine phosphoribosyltransferase [Candidatus Krumholzibacteria bacterium]|nr:hypoxanthine phosphoribosyltransferase [Candidatus Krumholzibacteria bacterium]